MCLASWLPPRFSGPRREQSDARDVAMVCLSGRRPPANQIESWLAQELAGSGGRPLGQVVEAVAERWLRDEIGRGGWVTDVGIWGPSIMVRDVAQALRRLDGDFVLISEVQTTEKGSLPCLAGP